MKARLSRSHNINTNYPWRTKYHLIEEKYIIFKKVINKDYSVIIGNQGQNQDFNIGPDWQDSKY
jgi:hypothetical protein